MFSKILVSIAAISLLHFNASAFTGDKILSTHEISLDTRYQNSFVNNVFKENILLALAYMRGNASLPVDWSSVDKPFHYILPLKPGEVFAFHDSVLNQYKGKMGYTTHAHFNFQQGFISDGYLVGDGVCHLASLVYWVAKDSGLDAVAPTDHNFADIPEVPKEYGVSIYYKPEEEGSSALQNLYVTNNKDTTVAFVFDFDGKNLKVTTQEN